MNIVIHGAGSIGCYVGASLHAASAGMATNDHAPSVTLLGRARIRDELNQHGAHLTDLAGRSIQLAAGSIPFSTDAAVLAQADLILLTVKSGATGSAAAEIATHARPNACVISLQNGLGNAEILRKTLQQKVLSGMVPFNVLHSAPGCWHRGTEGEIHIDADPAMNPWLPLFAAAHLPLVAHTNMPGVQWGKLLLNLNNAINALSGLPLRQQLSQRPYRRVLARCQREGLVALAAAGITPEQVARLPPQRIPALLDLPDWLFRLLAARMLRIDPQARSSMWEDLQQGRMTEVDELNGQIVRLARQVGSAAPVNARLVELVHAAEGKAAAGISGAEMLALVNG